MYRILPLLLAALGCQEPQDRASRDSLAPVSAAGTVQYAEFSDSTLRAAARALQSGRPWHATELLEPVVRDPARRTPDAVLLAAEAAAAWGGWARVDALLASETWLDSLQDGRGRTLLARAALERDEARAAAGHARLAMERAPSDRERGARTVTLARALDRLDVRDSAAAAYEAAAEALPEIGDWLRLRAAGVTPDSVDRARLYGDVRGTAARERIAISEALARARVRDFAGASRAYTALGMPVAALEHRLLASPDPASREAARAELLRLVASPQHATARAATALLDRAFDSLSAQEQLVVARSAARTGPASRAITGFARAFAAKVGTDADRAAYGDALFASDRYREAAAQYARVAQPRSLAASTAYKRGRALLRAGDAAAARTALARAARTYASEREAAADALYLLGDIATDAGDDVQARAHDRAVAERYPGTDPAPTAHFRAAMIAWVRGDVRVARQELDALVRRHAGSDERNAAEYWAGRAWLRTGNADSARARWRAIIARDPFSYYAMTSARRLGEPVPAPAQAPGEFVRFASIDSAIGRAAMLDRLGMNVEERHEYDGLVEQADSGERALATASALLARGRPASAIRIAWRAMERGAPRDSRAMRLAYPVVHESTLVAEARRRDLDRALVAALIRQESSFEPRATSPVGARGLMQLMPRVGEQIARTARFPVWDPALLYDPDVNMRLGTAHLAGLLKRDDEATLVRSLAAYNAGGSRVRRWNARAGVSDPEVFIERIPYVETRDYVRIVLRNRELYRSLYGW